MTCLGARVLVGSAAVWLFFLSMAYAQPMPTPQPPQQPDKVLEMSKIYEMQWTNQVTPDKLSAQIAYVGYVNGTYWAVGNYYPPGTQGRGFWINNLAGTVGTNDNRPLFTVAAPATELFPGSENTAWGATVVSDDNDARTLNYYICGAFVYSSRFLGIVA